MTNTTLWRTSKELVEQRPLERCPRGSHMHCPYCQQVYYSRGTLRECEGCGGKWLPVPGGGSGGRILDALGGHHGD